MAKVLESLVGALFNIQQSLKRIITEVGLKDAYYMKPDSKV